VTFQITNKTFENVIGKCKRLRTTVTNRNYIYKDIVNKLNLEDALYYSVQNILSTRILSKNLKFEMYKTIILPVYFV
jgi:hypothetical protein